MSHSPGPWRWNSERTALLRPTNQEEKQARVYPDPPVPDDLPVMVFCEDHGYVPDEADAALIERAPEMLELLKELEWQGTRWFTDIGGLPSCLLCGHVREKHPSWDRVFPGDEVGHAPDCRLGSLLDRMGR